MVWNCRPRDTYTALYRTAYLAGYSDGFNGHEYGLGFDEPSSVPTYATGFAEGQADARVVISKGNES